MNKSSFVVKSGLVLVFTVMLLAFYLPVIGSAGGFTAEISMSPQVSGAGYEEHFVLAVKNTRSSGSATIKNVYLWIANYNVSVVYNVTGIEDPDGWNHTVEYNGTLVSMIHWSTSNNGIEVNETKYFNFTAIVPHAGGPYLWKVRAQSANNEYIEWTGASRVLHSIRVFPPYAEMVLKESRVFNAVGYDSEGVEMDNLTFDWNVTDDLGSFNNSINESSVNFTAENRGNGEITAFYENIINHSDISISNRPPVLDPIGDKSVNESQTLEFTISASDPDNDTLTYSASGLPDDSSFDPDTRTFTWVTDYNDAGVYPGVTFTVEDGYGGNDSESITITVNNVNRPPVLDPIGDKSVG
jgi:hypothetical protein